MYIEDVEGCCTEGRLCDLGGAHGVEEITTLKLFANKVKEVITSRVEDAWYGRDYSFITATSTPEQKKARKYLKALGFEEINASTRIRIHVTSMYKLRKKLKELTE